MIAEHVLQPDILAAEDVVLADAALLQRQQMAPCHVVDMHEIEAGVDEGRHAAIRRLHDDAPGRRRLHVARPDRRRRADDHRGQPVADHALDQAFGNQLASLVGADDGSLLWREVSSTAVPCDGFSAATRRGVDDALDAGIARRLHHGAGAFEIVAHDLLGIARPQSVVGRDVEDIAHAVHRLDH